MNDCALDAEPEVYWLYGKDGLEYDISQDKVNKFGTDTRSQRMNWMLVKTMGSPEAFKYRSQELSDLGLPSDDESTASSFIRITYFTYFFLQILEHVLMINDVQI